MKLFLRRIAFLSCCVALLSVFAQQISASNNPSKSVRSEQKAVKKIAQMIDSLPEPSLIECAHEQRLDAVDYALSILSRKAQKNLTLERLEKVELCKIELAAKKAANDFAARVARLPYNLPENYADTIADLYKSYDYIAAQYGEQPTLTEAYNRLEKAQSRIIDQRAVASFAKEASELPAVVSLENRQKADSLQQLYQFFTDAMRENVPAEAQRRLAVTAYQYALYDSVCLAFETKSLSPQAIESAVARLHKPLRDAIAPAISNYVVEQQKPALSASAARLKSMIEDRNFVIYFGYNKMIFGPTGRQFNMINRIISYLNAHPTLQLVVVGHADVGALRRRNNEQVAFERAHSVKAQFVLQGANEEQLIIKTQVHSDERPENRRVDFDVKEIKSAAAAH